MPETLFFSSPCAQQRDAGSYRHQEQEGIHVMVKIRPSTHRASSASSAG
jgi:hypothetical protein